jgi:hypothetical protein
VTSCSNDKPAVCTSADDLNSAVENLKSVDVTASNGVGDLQDKLGTVHFSTVTASRACRVAPPGSWAVTVRDPTHCGAGNTQD